MSVATIAERLYECARRAGTLRRDASPWRWLAGHTRDRWLAFAEAIASSGTAIHLGEPAADALYQAALDQPNPSKGLHEAIRDFESRRRS